MDCSATTTGSFAFGLNTNKKTDLPYSALSEIIETQNECKKGIYEWILSDKDPVRMYIDIDISIGNDIDLANAEQQYANALAIIKDYFPEITWNVATSITDKKLSAHVISNSHFSTMKTLKPVVLSLNKQNKYIDIAPYSTGTQKFRLPLSVKDGEGRPLSMAEGTELTDYILGNTHGLIEYIPVDKINMNANLKKALDNVPSEYWGKGWGEKPINWHTLKQIIYNIMPNDEGFKLLDKYSIDHNGYNIENNQTIWNSTHINAKYYNLQWLEKKLGKIQNSNDDKKDGGKNIWDQERIVQEVIKQHGENIIIEFSKKEYTHYAWDGQYWYKNHEGLIMNNIMETLKYIREKHVECSGLSIDYNFVKNVFNLLKTQKELIKTNIPWDENGLILPFKNVVYDLRTGTTRPHMKEDYITLTTGYDYIPSTPEERDILKEATINKIFANNPEGLDIALQEYASGLIGENFQHLFIHNGNGGNGKGIMSRLMGETLGNDFYLQAKAVVLQEGDKASSNPDKVNLAYKRYAVFPECEGSLNGTVVKDLFGGDKIKARDHHCSKTAHINHLTGVIETNDAPKFKKVGDGISRRVIFIDWQSSFSDKYKCDDYNKKEFMSKNWGKDFNDKYKLAFFDILAPIAKQIIERNLKLIIPKGITNTTNKYFNSCNVLTEYIEENIIEVENPTEKEYIQINDIIERFKQTKDFEEMDKNAQRKITNKDLNSILKTHPIYKNNWRERIKKQGMTVRSVLMNYTWKEPQDNNNICLINSDNESELSANDTRSIDNDDTPPCPKKYIIPLQGIELRR